MTVFEEGIERAKRFLRYPSARVEKTDYGIAVIRGNYVLAETVELFIRGKPLDLTGKVLHQRVIIFDREIPIRSHQEQDQEIVVNIGENTVGYRNPTYPLNTVRPQNSFVSHDIKSHGFYHGWGLVSEGDTGMLYVAKALKPEFVQADSDSFKMPTNDYIAKGTIESP